MIPYIPNQPRSLFSRSKLLPVSAALVLAAAGYAEAANYRYYRFTPTALGSGTAVQMSEFDLYKGTTKVTYPTGTTCVSSFPAGDGGTADATTGIKSEGASKLIDGSVDTKWYNGGTGGVISSFTIDVGATTSTNTLDCDGYRFATANDAANRRPISWKLEGSNDNTTWVGLDTKANYATPTAFKTYTPVIALPAVLPPLITAHTVSPVIVKNTGSATTSFLNYTAENANAVTLTPTAGVTGTLDPAVGFITIDPPNSATTTYTLTATSTQTTATTPVNFTLRSVVGGSSSYQYVRFTPKKSSGGQIQLADLLFYNADVLVQAVSANYDGATTPDVAAEGPNKLIDNNAGTKWFSGALVPVVFDFGSTVSIDSYSFTAAGDAATYPGRNPQNWIMEGSSSASGPWTLIENVTSFDYPFPATNGAFIPIPLPGTSLDAVIPTVTKFASFRDAFFSDSPTTLQYGAQQAGKLTLQTGSGPEVELSQDLTTVDVNPAATTTYTFRAYAKDLVASKTVAKTITLSPATTTLPTTINYPNGFGSAGYVDFAILGSAGFANDTAITLPGDVTRLRITPDVGGVQGYAWFKTKVLTKGGFVTDFDAQPTTVSRGYGAEGLAFVIQNATEGTALTYTPAEKGPVNNALTIELSAWDNGAVAPNTINEARIRVLKGTGGTAQEIAQYNLAADTNIAPLLAKNGFTSLTGDYKNAPYSVHVVYTAAGKLSITFGGFPTITDLAVDLSDVFDAEGKSWAGFSARNGGWTENADITKWTLTSTPIVTPTNDLKITSSSFDFTASTLTLNFVANAGVTYRATHSATLNGTDWTAIGSTVTASGSTGTLTVPFTKGTKDFFRVEVAP